MAPRAVVCACVLAAISQQGCLHGRRSDSARQTPAPRRRNISRDRGLRAVLEATGSLLVLFALSWRLAPVLGTIIVCTGVAAALYRRFTRSIESQMAQALRAMSRVAAQAFRNVRTVRSFAGAAPAATPAPVRSQLRPCSCTASLTFMARQHACMSAGHGRCVLLARTT